MSQQESLESLLEPPDGPRITWGIREVSLGFLVVVAAYIFVAAAMVVPAELAFGEDSYGARIVNVVSVTVVDLLVVAGVLRLAMRTGATFQDLGFRTPRRPDPKPSISGLINPPRGFPWGYTLALIAGGLVTAYLSTGIYGLIVDSLGIEALQPDDQIPEDFFEGTAVIIGLGIGVVGAAPIAEELFFRGFFYPGVRKHAGLIVAALTSSLLFSMAHFQVGLIIPFAIIGLIFVYLYQRTDSLIPPIGMHLCFNLFSFLVLVFYPDAR